MLTNTMRPQVTTEHHKGQAEIFKNPFLESLTKTTLTSNIIVYGLTVLILVYVALQSTCFIDFYSIG